MGGAGATAPAARQHPKAAQTSPAPGHHLGIHSRRLPQAAAHRVGRGVQQADEAHEAQLLGGGPRRARPPQRRARQRGRELRARSVGRRHSSGPRLRGCMLRVRRGPCSSGRAAAAAAASARTDARSAAPPALRRTLTQGMMCACGALNRVSVISWLTMFSTTPEHRYSGAASLSAAAMAAAVSLRRRRRLSAARRRRRRGWWWRETGAGHSRRPAAAQAASGSRSRIGKCWCTQCAKHTTESHRCWTSTVAAAAAAAVNGLGTVGAEKRTCYSLPGLTPCFLAVESPLQGPQPDRRVWGLLVASAEWPSAAQRWAIVSTMNDGWRSGDSSRSSPLPRGECHGWPNSGLPALSTSTAAPALAIAKPSARRRPSCWTPPHLPTVLPLLAFLGDLVLLRWVQTIQPRRHAQGTLLLRAPLAAAAAATATTACLPVAAHRFTCPQQEARE